MGACVFAWRLASTRQAPAVFSEPPVTIVVDTMTATMEDHAVEIQTRGQVMARTQSSLVPEVSGSILEVGKCFREGGFFETGDILVRLDDRDYKAALATAQSGLATARTQVAQEEAAALQAVEDWKRLGRKEAPSPLVAREPQLAEARAKVDAMQAQVEKAMRDLERTVIRAPYKGRVLEQLADLGQYVTSGREIGRVFAVDYAEVRLPISDEQLAYLDLPEAFRGQELAGSSVLAGGGGEVQGLVTAPGKGQPQVTLRAVVAGKSCEWVGTVVRTSAVVDSETLQSYVTAQVQDPYGKKEGSLAPLKVGQWVEATIRGKTIPQVIPLPRSAVRDGNEVLVVGAGNKLSRRAFTRAWATGDVVYASGGLAPGEIFCTTPLAYAVEGAVVSPVTAVPAGKGVSSSADASTTQGPKKQGAAEAKS